jgi:hypothetical protein
MRLRGRHRTNAHLKALRHFDNPKATLGRGALPNIEKLGGSPEHRPVHVRIRVVPEGRTANPGGPATGERAQQRNRGIFQNHMDKVGRIHLCDLGRQTRPRVEMDPVDGISEN